MDRFYTKWHRTYNKSEPVYFTFISNRLLKIIEKKQETDDWIRPYFPLKNVVYNISERSEKYIGRLISSTGVVLFTKD